MFYKRTLKGFLAAAVLMFLSGLLSTVIVHVYAPGTAGPARNDKPVESPATEWVPVQ